MIELHLTEQELNIVGQALGQLPYLQVVVLISKINEQVNSQLKEKGE